MTRCSPRSYTFVFGSALGALVVLAGAASAAPPPKTASADAFLARHPGDWRVSFDPVTAHPTFVYGDRVPLGPPLESDGGYERRARQVVDDHREFFGFDARQLLLRRVVRLDLAAIGSSDKVAVVFDQVVEGVPVRAGSATVLFDAATGDLLALDSTGVPGADRAGTFPVTTIEEAVGLASDAFVARHGVLPTSIESYRPILLGPSLFEPGHPLVARGVALAWEIELSAPGERDAEGLPLEVRAFVSAEGDPSVFSLESRVHRAVDGNVCGRANLGPEPNSATNLENLHLGNLFVQANNAFGPVLAVTTKKGDFSVPAGAAAALFIALRGPFFDVRNQSAPSSFFSIPGAVNGVFRLTFNLIPNEWQSAEVATAVWIDRFRDFVKGLSANDPTMDFPVVANVNIPGFCDGFWNGTAIHFGRVGPGCPTNSAYRSVVHHEEGHWANHRYNGPMSGAFHEGLADAWAYFISDDPCFAFDFNGPGSGCSRNGNVGVLKCAVDGNETCHGGEVHLEGTAIASALWKTRRNLKNAHGVMAGGTIASRLFLAWMQTFDDNRTRNVVLDHWLVLDDDNGSLADGTPHLASIDGAFVEQGWPATQLGVPYGAGCPGGTGKVPLLTGSGSGKSFTTYSLFVTNAPAGSTGVFLTSLTSQAAPLPGGCTMLVGPATWVSGVYVTDFKGRAHVSLPVFGYAVPTNVHTQAFGALRSASNGLLTVFGP